MCLEPADNVYVDPQHPLPEVNNLTIIASFMLP